MNGLAKQWWRYSLRWSLPHIPCPGPREIASLDVPPGSPCPTEIERLWRPGDCYAVCIDFIDLRPKRRWTIEQKARVRRRNLERRVLKAAPLFADELIERELAARPTYFAGRT